MNKSRTTNILLLVVIALLLVIAFFVIFATKTEAPTVISYDCKSEFLATASRAYCFTGNGAQGPSYVITADTIKDESSGEGVALFTFSKDQTMINLYDQVVKQVSSYEN